MGIAERKEREKAERRRSILEAARELIKEKTFEEITMEEIARSLELSRATIYLYFSNKSEIFATLLIEGMRELKQGYEQAQVEGISEPMDKVRALAIAFFQFYAANHHYFDLIVTKRNELLRDSSEEVQAEFSEAGSAVIDPVADVYQQGIDGGRFPKFPPEKMAYLLRAVAIGMAVGFREGNLKFPEDIALMEQLVMFGVKGAQNEGG